MSVPLYDQREQLCLSIDILSLEYIAVHECVAKPSVQTLVLLLVKFPWY